MYHYRLLISYKGSRYFGWQSLGSIEDKPTVQDYIYQALKRICKYQECTVSGASRTDAGVHAQGQVVKVAIPVDIESNKLLLGMNSLLPNDIRILQCEPCDTVFNANKHSDRKEYHYYFCTNSVSNPILSDIVVSAFNKHNGLSTELIDLAAMRQGCDLFVGEHDFCNFSKRDAGVNATVRTLFNCELVKLPSMIFGDNIYYIKIVGNGFLKYMIRYIVGALFALGRGELELDNIRVALEGKEREKVSAKAKPQGLHLIEIFY